MTPHANEGNPGAGLVLTAVLAVLLAAGVVALFYAPEYVRRQKVDTENSVRHALRTIGTAQAIFRECNPSYGGEARYATLAELGTAKATGLIDAELASGTQHGYVFECSYGASTSEFLWFATARPVSPGFRGDRSYATNHTGVIYYTTGAPFQLNTVDCAIPPNSQPDH